VPRQQIDADSGPHGRTGTACLCGALALALLGLIGRPAYSEGGGSCTPDPSCTPRFNLSGYDKGAKTPINNCKTNDSGSPCAWADVITRPENFLACSLETTGPIALCYYSGVPGFPLLTPGCTFAQGKAAANCDCYKISEGRPEGAKFSYIEITAILNKEVYEQTVAQCGPEGDGCLNATNLDDDDPPDEAPVCDALRDGTLFPGADLISTFTPILVETKGIVSFDCPNDGSAGNRYAGCMTAPCKETGKIDITTALPIVKCTCPTYNGPNQVGNPQIGDPQVPIQNYSCSPTPHVWSSAYSTPADPLLDPLDLFPTEP
jgi:hypothetical protein